MVPQKVKQGTPLAQEYNETNSQFAMEALIANNKYRVRLKIFYYLLMNLVFIMKFFIIDNP
jgi:hypothetical protein